MTFFLIREAGKKDKWESVQKVWLRINLLRCLDKKGWKTYKIEEQKFLSLSGERNESVCMRESMQWSACFLKKNKNGFFTLKRRLGNKFV